MGFGLHDFNLNLKKRKLLEELYLVKIFKKFWISISSFSKIPLEKFFCRIGVADNSFFYENEYIISKSVFSFLSNYCSKICWSSKKYIARKTLKNSHDFPIESSWKNFIQEKANIILNFPKNRNISIREAFIKLGFFITRLNKNLGFYFHFKKAVKLIFPEKILSLMILKLKKKKYYFPKIQRKLCQNNKRVCHESMFLQSGRFFNFDQQII